MTKRLIAFGLLAATLPATAWAEVCDKARPAWDGTPVSAWQETIFLLSTIPALVLIVASLLAIRFRHQWGALVVVVLWTILVTMISMADPTGLQKRAAAEGCVGSPALFIGLVAAICVGMILYTAPRPSRPD